MIGLGIVDNNVGVGALGNDALAGEHTVELGGILAEHLAHGGKGDLAGGDTGGIDQLTPCFHTGDTAGDGGEVVAAGLLLGQSEAAVVGGDGLDLPPAQRTPKCLLIADLANGRRADIFGGLQIIGVIVHAVVQHQILGTGFHIHLLTALAGRFHLLQGGGVGQMDDDHGNIHRLRDTQQTGNGLGLQIVGAGFGMAGYAVDIPCLLFLD